MIGDRISPALASGLAAIAIVVIMIVGSIPGLARAVLTSGSSGEATDFLDKSVALHQDLQKTARGRFDGRSVFFKPPQPVVQRDRPKPPPVTMPQEIDREPPKPAGPPARYTGPSIMAFVGDTVWFQGDLRVSAGEEDAGVRVISVDAPWSARLGFRGGEYDVTLFENETSGFLQAESAAAPSRLPGLIPVENQIPAETPGASGDDAGAPSDTESTAAGA